MARISHAEMLEKCEQALAKQVLNARETQAPIAERTKTRAVALGRKAVVAGDVELPPPADEKESERLQIRRDRIRPNDPNGLERLVGERDIVSINFFARGVRAARSVCRIKTLSASNGPPDYASGFLAAPGLLVTNNHVLPDPETAARSLAEFDYELDLNFVDKRGRIFPFAPMEAFYTNAALDMTLVAISPMGHDGTPITDFGWLRLIPESGKGIPGEFVSIIQHPMGGTKQVVVRENKIIALGDTPTLDLSDFIHYTADTERGSSGSPVFNDQWDLVALHHKAIARRNDDGEILNKKGEVWTAAEGDEAKDWIGNEGVRISAVIAHLKSAAPFDASAARILALLASEPNTARTPRRARETVDAEKSWLTLPNAPEFEAFGQDRFTDPAFTANAGYNPDFLGKDLKAPLPKTTAKFRGTLAVNEINKSNIFDYTHFSLAMSVERRLAVWTAVNIDGEKLKSSKSSPGWRRDPRLPANQQTLAEVYGTPVGKSIQIDRGHLVRRLDPVWGTQEVADRAAADTFHYTNCAPQEHLFNSDIWGNLEDFLLARADKTRNRVSVMTGPVLLPNDDFFGHELRGGPWQIPWSFWKIAIFRRPDNSPSVTGFVMEQAQRLSPLFESTRYNPYSVEEAKVFQRPVALIEDLTGLDFGNLKTLDRMGDVESTSPMSARAIRSANDIVF